MECNSDSSLYSSFKSEREEFFSYWFGPHTLTRIKRPQTSIGNSISTILIRISFLQSILVQFILFFFSFLLRWLTKRFTRFFNSPIKRGHRSNYLFISIVSCFENSTNSVVSTYFFLNCWKKDFLSSTVALSQCSFY